MSVDFEYLYETYFKQYHQAKFDNNDILFKDEIIDVLNSAYKDLNYLKNSKISINQYERDIRTIERNRAELQRFSEDKITLTLPKHPSEIYFFMRNYLVNIYSIKEDCIAEAFKGLYDEVFKLSSHKKPKTIKRIKQLVDDFYTATTTIFRIISEMSEEEKIEIAKKHFDKKRKTTP